MKIASPALTRIVEHKRAQVVALLPDAATLRAQAAQARSQANAHSLRAALGASAPALIAEVKRSSPSAGAIRSEDDIVSRALAYVRGGAAAVSVLTEESRFGGSLEDLRNVSAAIAAPVLRKDFTLDAVQIYEAAAAGASAVLLIVALLEGDEVARLLEIAENELGMDALVEVHSANELEVARKAGATLIGVNNRNLSTLTVSLDVARELAIGLRSGEFAVAESGITQPEQIRELSSLGYRAFLIGEALMRSDDPEAGVRNLLGQEVAR